jgi:hypothetical protein
LTEGAELRLGTSLNSLGRGKISEISVLTPDEVARNTQDVMQYITGVKREHAGERLDRTSFTL